MGIFVVQYILCTFDPQILFIFCILLLFFIRWHVSLEYVVCEMLNIHENVNPFANVVPFFDRL